MIIIEVPKYGYQGTANGQQKKKGCFPLILIGQFVYKLKRSCGVLSVEGNNAVLCILSCL